MIKINGVPIEKYGIVIPRDADETVITAKDELSEYIRKACGCELPVFTDGEQAEYEIVLDKCDRGMSAYALIPALKNNDGFVIKSEGKRLLIAGKESAGTLYGVYDFLERFLGVEWFTPEIESVEPEPRDIRADIVYDFPCKIRIVHAHNMWDEKFRARKRLSFTVGETNNKLAYGNLRGVEFAFSWGLFGHTFEVLLPYKQYFTAHPEWFSFAEGRYGEEGRHQICLTNPEVFDIVLKNVLGYLKTHPTCKIISVSQNDSYADFADNYCRCDGCMAVAEREQSYAGVNLEFVNRIAAEVEKHYPDVLVHTFCYKYTSEPPRFIKPRDNVLVQLCINVDYGVSLTDEKGKETKEYVDKWRAISKNLYLWTYPCFHAMYALPMGNFKTIYENTQYLYKSNVYGIFQQENGDYFPGNFCDLRFYLLSKLFVRPEMTFEEYKAYAKKFLSAVYGNAAEYIYEYIELLDELYEGVNEVDNELFVNAPFIEKGASLFEKAIAAENGQKRERAEKLSIQFKYAELVYLYDRMTRGEVSPEVYEEKHRKYWEMLKASGAKRFRENGNIPDLKTLGYLNPPYKVGPRRKKLVISEGKTSETIFADANSNSAVTDFTFGFTAKAANGILDINVDVTDNDPSYVNNANLDDWAQNSVEFFLSETCSEDTRLSAGDYKLRVNSEGKYTAFGSDSKIVYVNALRTENGYMVRAGFVLPENCDKLGFEIMAHNVIDGKYINTRYWNAYDGMLVPTNPSVYGIIEMKR